MRFDSPVNIKFIKTHPAAQLPKQNHSNLQNNIECFLGTHDTGFDIFCCEDTIVPAGSSAVVPTGLQLAYIDQGYWIRIEARSGLGFKHSIEPHFGIIDNQYTGNFSVKLFNFSDIDYHARVGDRIAQLVLYKLYNANIEWTDQVQDSHRGSQGFGSSGS